MHFGQRLKQLREAQSLSQTDLAARINVSSSAISRIEKGERDPELYTVFELAKGLGMTVRDLIEPLDSPVNDEKEVTHMTDQQTTRELFAQLIQTSRETEQTIERIRLALTRQTRAAKAVAQRQTWLRFLRVYIVIDARPWSRCYIYQRPRYGTGHPFL